MNKDEVLTLHVEDILPDNLVDILAEYWCDPNDNLRNENLGEFIQRVAQIGYEIKSKRRNYEN